VEQALRLQEAEEMTLQKLREITTNETLYYLRISDCELVMAELDTFDIMLIRECDTSASVADKLLALETIVRRIEQAKGAPQP
jgi:hypothetical protein